MNCIGFVVKWNNDKKLMNQKSFVSHFKCRASIQLDKATGVCHTAGCVSAAADVLKFIDATIDPCDDFYDFACGKFLSGTTLTDEKVSVDTFSIARDKMQSQLLRLIDSPVEPDDLEYCHFICPP